MKIKIDSIKCTGCHLCELVCSLFHLSVMNTEKSAIRIVKDDLNTNLNRPIVCRQCKEMKCIEGESVEEAAERRKFIWSKQRADHCPFDALRTNGDWAYHCNLCGGKPQCIKVCTTKAIYVNHSSNR